MRQALRAALAEKVDAERVLSDPAWPRLAGLLSQVAAHGHNVEQVLANLVAERALRDDVESPSRSEAQVLVRRVRRWLATQSPTPAQDKPAIVAGAASRQEARRVEGVGRERAFARAMLKVVEAQECSAVFLERALWLRPEKAAALLAELEARGVVAADGRGGYAVVPGRERLPQLRGAAGPRGEAARLSSARRPSSAGNAPSVGGAPSAAPPPARRPDRRQP